MWNREASRGIHWLNTMLTPGSNGYISPVNVTGGYICYDDDCMKDVMHALVRWYQKYDKDVEY